MAFLAGPSFVSALLIFCAALCGVFIALCFFYTLPKNVTL